MPAQAGAWFEELVAVQARLRAPKGCPWDREQTHRSLRTYLIEEAYEVLDALESGNDAKLADELGDLLLQVLFHADIAREDGRFDVLDVIRAIHDKMIRRHPHVFGNVTAKNATEVLRNWDRIKLEERLAEERREVAPHATAQSPVESANGKARKGAAPSTGVSPAAASVTKKPAPSLLDGVTRSLPAALEGLQLTRKASRIGFDWDDAQDVLAKVREESAEIQKALAAENRDGLEEEIGDLLFAAVNLARFLKIDPEIALKQANGKFSSRFRAMEAMAREGGRELAAVPRDEMEKFWDAAKKREKREAANPKARGDGTSVPGSASIAPEGFGGTKKSAGKIPALLGKRPPTKRRGAGL